MNTQTLNFATLDQAAGLELSVIVKFYKGRIVVASGMCNANEMLIGQTEIKVPMIDVLATDYVMYRGLYVSNQMVNRAVSNLALKYFDKTYPNEFLYNYSTCVTH